MPAFAKSLATALAEPEGPVAVMVTLPDDGMVAGAVKKPLVVIVPAVAVHEVAPADVNCCVPPRASETVVGEMV